MIRKHQNATGQVRYILAPTRSASWPQIQWFFTLIAGVSGVIALMFALQGFWPVLPFAGAELALLWFCFYKNATAGLVTEVIDIDHSTVAVQRDSRCEQRRWSFKRAWIQIRLQPAAMRLHSSQLLLRSHGKTVRLGAFLTEDERLDVARQLRNTLSGSEAPYFQNNI
jgi:uncharacterized membrane protein